MRILDAHLHLGLSGDGGEATEAGLRSLMQSHTIEKGIVFPIDDGAGIEDYRTLNGRVLRLQQESGGAVIGFCRVSPKAREAVALLREALDSGLQGLKLHPTSDAFCPEEAIPVLETAADRAVPVVLHTGHKQNCRPEEWAPVFRRFSSVRFLLTHGGKDTYRTLPDLVAALPNLYCDTSCLSFFRSTYLFERMHPERLLYGSDYPYSHPQLEQQKIRLIVRDKAVLEKIFYENALDFLGAGNG